MEQTELDLTPRAAPRRVIRPPSYRFAEDALIEQQGDRRIVYGLWERLFGCWLIDARTGRSREALPTWKPLRANGVWCDQAMLRYTNGKELPLAFARRWRYEANAAFAGYFSGIPLTSRALAAAMDIYQWFTLDLIWQVPAFAAFLDEELFEERQQYLFACFALAAGETLSRARRRNLAAAVMHRPRHRLLAELAGITCAPAALHVLDKLGAAPCRAELYRALLRSLNDPALAKVLRHARHIERAALGVLGALPAALLLPNIVAVFLAEEGTGEVMAEIADGGARDLGNLIAKAPPGTGSRIREAARAIRSLDDFRKWVFRWIHRLQEIIDFPAAPLAPHPLLTPLRGADEMRAEARRMRNCLAEMIDEVLDGEAYFYRWNGRETGLATVMVTPDAAGRWTFVEANGPKNRALDPVSEAFIERLVTRLADDKHRRAGGHSHSEEPIPPGNRDL